MTCVFIHHSTSNDIPYYIEIYINELLKYCNKIIFNYDNENLIKTLDNDKIEYYYTENVGYDFGKWYKAINKYNLYNKLKLILINDSNILINELGDIFNFINTNLTSDFIGLTDSFENPIGIDENKSYHIQSHFMCFKNKGIQGIKSFFLNSNIEHLINNNIDNIKQIIVNNYEIGLSQYFLENKLNIKSIFSVKDFYTLYKKNIPLNRLNIYLYYWKELLNNKYPFIKKQILENRFNIRQIDIKMFHNIKNILPNYINENYNKEKLCTIM